MEGQSLVDNMYFFHVCLQLTCKSSEQKQVFVSSFFVRPIWAGRKRFSHNGNWKLMLKVSPTLHCCGEPGTAQ